MPRRLYRSRTERILFGVCGGLSKYFDVDPVLIRVGFVVFTFASAGIGIPAYIILAIVMPPEGSAAASPREAVKESIQEIKDTAQGIGEGIRSGLSAGTPPPKTPEAGAHRGRNMAGIILIIIGGFFLVRNVGLFWWWRWNLFWPIILIIVGALIIWSRVRR